MDVGSPLSYEEARRAKIANNHYQMLKILTGEMGLHADDAASLTNKPSQPGYVVASSCSAPASSLLVISIHFSTIVLRPAYDVCFPC